MILMCLSMRNKSLCTVRHNVPDMSHLGWWFFDSSNGLLDDTDAHECEQEVPPPRSVRQNILPVWHLCWCVNEIWKKASLGILMHVSVKTDFRAELSSGHDWIKIYKLISTAERSGWHQPCWCHLPDQTVSTWDCHGNNVTAWCSSYQEFQTEGGTVVQCKQIKLFSTSIYILSGTEM